MERKKKIHSGNRKEYGVSVLSMEVLQDLSTAKSIRCSQTKQSDVSFVTVAVATEVECHFHT